jgi:hypothetical protein
MTNSHVTSALRLKRAEISGHIHDLEKRIARQRANLANLDATIKLFSPGTNPDAIPAKRAYRRTRYFAHNELSRLSQDALREASGPLTSAEIAAVVYAVIFPLTLDTSASTKYTFCIGFSSSEIICRLR